MNRRKTVAIYPPSRAARQEGARSLAHASRENERVLQFTQGCWSTAPRLDGVT